MNQLILTNPEGRIGLNYIPVMRYYTDGVQEIPATATITVYNSNGVNICLNRGCTVGPTGDIYATLTSAEMIDYLNKYYLELTLGLGSAAVVLVGTITFVINLTPLVCPVVDADLKLIVPKLASEIWSEQTTYSAQIWLAFHDVQDRLKAQQKSPSIVIDAAQLKTPIIWRSLWYIFQDFSMDQGDKWYTRMILADKEYNDSFDNIQLDVDEDHDKRHDETEPQAAGSMEMFR